MRANRDILFVFLMLLFSTDSTSRTETVDDDSDYVLVFSDEFNQPDGSRPDSTKWSSCQRYPGHWSRWISSSPEVAFIKNGRLVCRAIPNRTEPMDTAAMLTGAIETRNKFEFQYGKIEVRMKTNMKQGNFPAAWMVPTYKDGDKRYGEIDIVEMFGNEGMSAHTAHTHRTYTLKKRDGIKNAQRYKVSVKKWHVYGVIWTKDSIVWMVDGKTVLNYYRVDTPKMVEEGQWTFDRPFFIRLNQSVGNGSYEVMIPHIDELYETQFDWVRVYRKK